MEIKKRIPKCFFNPVFVSALLCAALFYSGIFTPRRKPVVASLIPPASIVAVEGRVSSNPVKTSAFGGCYCVEFAVERTFSRGASSSAAGNYRLYIPSAVVEASFPGKLRTAAGKSGGAVVENGIRLRASVEKRIRGGFSVVAVSPASVHETESFWNRFFFFLVRLRARCRLAFRGMMHSWGEAGGFLLALISGSRDCVDGSVSDGFRHAGLSHVMALSGMHLSLFGGIASFLGRRLSTRRFADALSFFAIVFFVWFAGLSPSLFRALLCSCILSASSSLRLKRPAPATVLSLSFLVHFAVFPTHVFDAAFMLSYASLGGIVLLQRSVSRFFSKMLFPRLSSSLSASVSAFAATTPVSLSLFGTVYPVGLLSTVVVSPLVGVFMYAGIFGIAVCLAAPFLSVPFGAIISFIYGLVKKTALFFAGFPAFSIF